jgi:hypothetical protein
MTHVKTIMMDFFNTVLLRELFIGSEPELWNSGLVCSSGSM